MSCRGQRSLHASIPCEKRNSAAVKGFALSASFAFSARHKALRVQPHCRSSSAIHLDPAAASHVPPKTASVVKPACALPGGENTFGLRPPQRPRGDETNAAAR